MCMYPIAEAKASHGSEYGSILTPGVTDDDEALARLKRPHGALEAVLVEVPDEQRLLPELRPEGAIL